MSVGQCEGQWNRLLDLLVTLVLFKTNLLCGLLLTVYALYLDIHALQPLTRSISIRFLLGMSKLNKVFKILGIPVAGMYILQLYYLHFYSAPVSSKFKQNINFTEMP